MVIKALDSEGKNVAALLARCNIDIKSLKDPDFRVPVDQVGELLRIGIFETGDPAFGLKVGTFVNPTTFGALSMSMWLSSTLKEAFDRVVRYGPLLSDAGSTGLGERDNEYYYWTELAGEGSEFVNLLDPAAMDAVLCAMLTFCRSVYGPGFTLRRVSLMRDKPENIDPWLACFGCPVDFSQPTMALTFDRDTMTKLLPSGHPELLKHSDHVIVESLTRFNKQDIVNRLRAQLMRQLPNGKPSQSDTASALHCSLRSLQRKLNEQGLTYKTVLNEVRYEQGLKYIAQPHLSIGDISYLLGFSSSTNFSRKFKSWTGVTPREYRRHTLSDNQ